LCRVLDIEDEEEGKDDDGDDDDEGVSKDRDVIVERERKEVKRATRESRPGQATEGIAKSAYFHAYPILTVQRAVIQTD
jgi:hypothetical protein